METTKTNRSVHNEGTSAMEKLFNSATAAMMDIYKKQMDLTTGFYNNFLNSGGNQNNGYANIFSGIDTTKWFSNPFLNFSTASFQNPFLPQLDKSLKQISEFNQNILSSLTNGFSGKMINWDAMTDGYKENFETRVEASKKILSTLSDTINKQMETSMETNKKTFEEINNQVELVMKQNQKFWTDILKTLQFPLTEEGKDSEYSSNTHKKRSHVTVS